MLSPDRILPNTNKTGQKVPNNVSNSEHEPKTSTNETKRAQKEPVVPNPITSSTTYCKTNMKNEMKGGDNVELTVNIWMKFFIIIVSEWN